MPTSEYQRAWRAANPRKAKEYRDADRQRRSAAPRPHCACGAVVPTHRSTICKNCRSFIQQIVGLPQRKLKRCDECRTAPHRKGRCIECIRAQGRARWKERVADPAKRPAIRARQSATGGRRRAIERMTDVTPADIRRLLTRTYCPLCRKRMTDEPHLPNSKHVDHIIPVNPSCNGTHTLANIRVICRTCNLSRPVDGSDVEGQVALWQAEPAFAPRERVARVKAHKPPRERMHCMPRAPKAPRKYEHLYPFVSDLLDQGHGYKRIASAIGVSRDTARSIARIVRRNEQNAQMSHA